MVVAVIIASCSSSNSSGRIVQKELPIEGTWKLLSGTIIEKGDTVVTDYTHDRSFIKIINKTHFAFLSHAVGAAKDSASAYSSGGGRYTLTDRDYTENLEYCSSREWEGNKFSFTVEIKNDTLIQKGVEKVEKAGIERINIEKYIRLKE